MAGEQQSDDIGIVEGVGSPVTFAHETQGLSFSPEQYVPLPWDINLLLTEEELRNPTTIQQILRLMCSG